MESLVGHGRQREWLHNLAIKQELSHAYLFSGPEGVGKSEIALEIATTLYCEIAQKPCNECVACRQVISGSHPDLKRLKRDESATMDDVRDVRDWLSGSSFDPRGKVLIVEEMGRLSTMAQNALLKSIEEPSGKSYIFLTDSTDRVIPTIRSRTQVVRFGLTHADDDSLPESLRAVAAGRPGALLEYAKADLRRDDEELLALLSGLAKRSLAELSIVVDELAAREDLERVINLWITYLGAHLSGEANTAIQVERLLQLRDQLRSNVNPRLAVWAALLSIKLATR